MSTEKYADLSKSRVRQSEEEFNSIKKMDCFSSKQNMQKYLLTSRR